MRLPIRRSLRGWPPDCSHRSVFRDSVFGNLPQIFSPCWRECDRRFVQQYGDRRASGNVVSFPFSYMSCLTARGHLTRYGQFLDSIPLQQIQRRVPRAASGIFLRCRRHNAWRRQGWRFSSGRARWSPECSFFTACDLLAATTAKSRSYRFCTKGERANETSQRSNTRVLHGAHGHGIHVKRKGGRLEQEDRDHV